MPKIVEVPGVGNVEFPDTMDDNAIGAVLQKHTAPSASAPSSVAESPRRKMASALTRLLPGMPGSDAENTDAAQQALGMGMGLTMPSPLPFVGQLLRGTGKAVAEGARKVAGSMFPKATESAAQSLDPIMQQAPRNPLPSLPKALEWVPGVGRTAKIYNMLRGATEPVPEPAVNPYPVPEAAPAVAASAPPASALPQATEQAVPQASALLKIRPKDLSPTTLQRLRQAIRSTAEPEAAAVQPSPAPPAAADLQPPAQAPAPSPVSVLQAPPPPPPPTTGEAFKLAMRGRKVSELTKAIDANAGAHLGVDPLDPRFAEALADLPQEWWDGMAQVAKVNKPSPDSVKQAVEFFRDRAAKAATAVAR